MREDTKDKMIKALELVKKGENIGDACKKVELGIGTFYNNRDKFDAVSEKPEVPIKTPVRSNSVSVAQLKEKITLLEQLLGEAYFKIKQLEMQS